MLPAAAQGIQEDDSAPIPPRYWWLKRILVVSAALFVALLALRLWWGWYADRQLQAEIDRIIAAGEPICPEDFDPKEHIPDDQNAAKLYERAAAQLQADFERITNFARNPALVLTKQEETRALIEHYAQDLRHVRTARGLRKTDWNVAYASPVFSTILPTLHLQSLLTKLLCIASVNALLEGKSYEAIEYLLDATEHSRALESYPFLVAHSVAARNTEAIAFAIEFEAPNLCSTAQPHPEDTLLERERIKKLITSLLEEETIHAALIQRMHEERMGQLDAVRCVLDGRASMAGILGGLGTVSNTWNTIGWFFDKPLLSADAIGVLRRRTALVKVARAQSLAEGERIFRTLPVERHHRFEHPFAKALRESGSGPIFLLHFKSIALQRLAATRLALRLFEVDQGGFPASLDQLVPDYLPKHLQDPFSPGGYAFVYQSSSNPPVVYSVGSDGLDEGGAYQVNSPSEDSPDIPIFLDGTRFKKGQDDFID